MGFGPVSTDQFHKWRRQGKELDAVYSHNKLFQCKNMMFLFGLRVFQEHQLMFYECSAASGHNVSESMVSFIR